MQEIWLYPNRRALWFGCAPLVAAAGLGLWLALGISAAALVWKIIGWILIGGALLGIAAIVNHVRRPRIAYRGGNVLFYLQPGRPIAAPVGLVEAFFVGQGPAGIPGGVAAGQETMNLVARLSQREVDWARRDVKPALGAWCGGYVTIRGAWCEPLTGEVIRRLNKRLKEVQAECERR